MRISIFLALVISVAYIAIATGTIINAWNLPCDFTGQVVTPGTLVIWNSTDGLPHTVSFTTHATEVIDSDQFTDGSYSITFQTLGTYSYQCAVHGSQMVGSIKVATTITTTGSASTVSTGAIGLLFVLCIALLF